MHEDCRERAECGPPCPFCIEIGIACEPPVRPAVVDLTEEANPNEAGRSPPEWDIVLHFRNRDKVCLIRSDIGSPLVVEHWRGRNMGLHVVERWQIDVPGDSIRGQISPDFGLIARVNQPQIPGLPEFRLRAPVDPHDPDFVSLIPDPPSSTHCDTC